MCKCLDCYNGEESFDELNIDDELIIDDNECVTDEDDYDSDDCDS